MYSPAAFQQTDAPTIQTFLLNHPFAILLSGAEAPFEATHLPLLWQPTESSQGSLIGHFARANRQWERPGADAVTVEAESESPCGAA